MYIHIKPYKSPRIRVPCSAARVQFRTSFGGIFLFFFFICSFQRLTCTKVSGRYGVSAKGQRSVDCLSASQNGCNTLRAQSGKSEVQTVRSAGESHRWGYWAESVVQSCPRCGWLTALGWTVQPAGSEAQNHVIPPPHHHLENISQSTNREALENSFKCTFLLLSKLNGA